MGATIIGTGKATPAFTVTNHRLSRIVDTSDEWIVPRTGIHTRPVSTGETATDLAAAAGRRALGWEGGAGLAPARPIEAACIDLVICMTLTGDTLIPSQAALVKARLGLPNAVAFDLNAACAGCVYGLVTAQSMMAAAHAPGWAGNPVRRALVIGVERMSRIVDWTDRATCVLFGDGAGAVLLEWDDARTGIVSSYVKNTDDTGLSLACGKNFDLATFPFGAEAAAAGEGADATAGPGADLSRDTIVHDEHARAVLGSTFVSMSGQKVFKFATSTIVEAIGAVLDRAGWELSDLDAIIPHQANERIIRYAAKKLRVPEDLFQLSIDTAGNTSAASALMALDDAWRQSKLHPGDKAVMVGFGGGLTTGALTFEA
ncbi:3-oxoacyl-ACP synthase III family protein [Hugonella massiliensis]|uniref:3-oxoacyl-ACP synthase III family protein n=1 Tax=Hugonella massiliensis TaxID=1720315 RepID=UPI00073F4E7A|nr:beta-ketoacyl-ACP synthase 3 [Hugonella massiliensis]